MVRRAGFTGKMALTKQISLLLLQSSLLVGSNQVETLGQVATSSARKGHQAADQPLSVRCWFWRFLFHRAIMFFAQWTLKGLSFELQKCTVCKKMSMFTWNPVKYCVTRAPLQNLKSYVAQFFKVCQWVCKASMRPVQIFTFSIYKGVNAP